MRTRQRNGILHSSRIVLNVHSPLTTVLAGASDHFPVIIGQRIQGGFVANRLTYIFGVSVSQNLA